ncbi:unnamed protein product [Phytomonas sp. Hart1]|nr:unnamed protein product [Phytomonas sp. Hart1]|eukprot:CCW68811.1 unnamed protein product [Phytomonas sp. isolate Hart1]
MSSSICRRLGLATNSSFDNSSLRAQLFLALASYGVLEFVSFNNSITGCYSSSANTTDEDYNFNNIVAQFQKLSSAENFHADAEQAAFQARQRWRVAFEPAAVPLVCSSLFLSSTNPLIPKTLLGSSVVSVHSTSLSVTGKTGLRLEEKLLKIPGATALLDESTILNSSIFSSTAFENTAENSQSLLQDITKICASCIGPYVGLLHFENAHDADHYLRSHQLRLAKENIFVTYVGPSTTGTTAGLSQAVPHLLTRHVLSPTGSVHLTNSEQVDGLIRGFVVKMKANTRCVVDAGLTTESYQCIMVDTHSNFLRVTVGDEVYIELLPSPADGTINTMPAITSTLEMNLRGVLKRVVDDHSNLQSQFAVSTNALSKSRRDQLPTTTIRSATATLDPSLQMTRIDTKTLASKLFQTIQRAKANGTLTQDECKGSDDACLVSNNSNSHGILPFQNLKRLCGYPHGLHLLSQVSVRVNQITDNGLNCTLLTVVEGHSHSTHSIGLLCNATAKQEPVGWPPVFIPFSLIPTSVPNADQSYAVQQVPTARGDWQNFAIVGERLTVAILYTTSIAGSQATRQLVASKLDVHLRYAASMSRHNTSKESLTESDATQEFFHKGFAEESTDKTSTCSGTMDEPTVAVGLRFDGIPVHTILPTDIGGFHGEPFPCHLVYPYSGSTLSLWALPLVLNTTLSPFMALGNDVRATPIRFVVSEVLNNTASGHYIRLLSIDDYDKKMEAKAQAEKDRKTKQWNDVKWRLASVLGEDAVQGLNLDEDVFTKKTRTE